MDNTAEGLRANSEAKTDVVQLIEMRTNSLQEQVNSLKDSIKKRQDEQEPQMQEICTDIAGLIL